MAGSNFLPSFLLLQQEGYLISSSLAAGLTGLRAGHVGDKGAIYSGLFNISIGLERLLKAIVVIDHMLRRKLAAPTRKELQGYGHNILALYSTVESIGQSRSCTVKSMGSLDSTTVAILELLGHFAISSRYHNLDTLGNSGQGIDPLEAWDGILLGILKTDISPKSVDAVRVRAASMAHPLRNAAYVVMSSLDKTALSLSDIFTIPSLNDMAARHAVLRIAFVISELRDLLRALCHLVYHLGTTDPPIPQMQEFLEWLPPDRASILRRKRWP